MADLAERLKVDAWNHGMQECNSRMAETFLVAALRPRVHALRRVNLGKLL